MLIMLIKLFTKNLLKWQHGCSKLHNTTVQKLGVIKSFFKQINIFIQFIIKSDSKDIYNVKKYIKHIL